ncbi:MAG: hypothetical protein PHF97_11000 [Bacteroidales bacterium]|nr:hypothetical protein [Bacteroidales bacterium]
MRRIFLSLILLLLTAGGFTVQAQLEAETDTTPDNVLLEKQWSLGAMIHTNGWGLKFHSGHNITALRQFMWEIEFSTYKSTKEVKTINPYFSDSRSYIYGKLNYLYFLRGGVGQQHILNRKPYWGGVQVSWLYYGGFSLGLTKPVYLYIIHFKSGYSDYEVKEERYDPEIHFVDNIYGRGSFLTGILNLGFYPGAYVKTGFDFEFGVKNKRISSLEIGGILDFSPIPIPIMAYAPKQNFFLTLYVSVMFGKRYNKY